MSLGNLDTLSEHLKWLDDNRIIDVGLYCEHEIVSFDVVTSPFLNCHCMIRSRYSDFFVFFGSLDMRP